MRPHVFVICAYQDSPYLEDCIRSVRGQSVATDVILCTSTPSSYIGRLAKRYGLPLYVREGESGIRKDWLFGWKMAAEGGYSLITIAHQDDVYHRHYVRHLLRAWERYPDLSVFCSDYVVLRTKERRTANGQLYPVSTDLVAGDMVRFVKKVLRLPLRLKTISDRAWVKKSVLMFGNSVCCPSCTYNRAQTGDRMFESELPFALDWENLYTLAMRPGRFICEERPLLAYRVHDGAATKTCIEDDRRRRDETAMFEKLWPRWAARFFMHFYQKAYEAYDNEK